MSQARPEVYVFRTPNRWWAWSPAAPRLMYRGRSIDEALGHLFAVLARQLGVAIRCFWDDDLRGVPVPVGKQADQCEEVLATMGPTREYLSGRIRRAMKEGGPFEPPACVKRAMTALDNQTGE